MTAGDGFDGSLRRFVKTGTLNVYAASFPFRAVSRAKPDDDRAEDPWPVVAGIGCAIGTLVVLPLAVVAAWMPAFVQREGIDAKVCP